MKLNKKLQILSTSENVFSWLEKFTNLEQGRSVYTARNYSLNRMAFFLDYFSHPEQIKPSIHIAGSKGKGSTAAFLANVLEAAGYKTGLYTSPHITSYLERIRINNSAPDEKLIVQQAIRLQEMLMTLTGKSLPEGEALDQPTTFELLTLLSWLVFQAAGCDFAVMETGLGGRLDATNLITPLASLITPIDLEHTNILGDTLEKIAFEKCGIIKNRIPVFSGLQKEEVKAVIKEAAIKKNTSVLFLDEELELLQAKIQEQGSRVVLKLKGQAEFDYQLRLNGDFQAENAALAYLTLNRILPGLLPGAIRSGFCNTSLPGRFEIIRKSAHLAFVLDGAHTPLAIQRLWESYEKIFLHNTPSSSRNKVQSLLIFGTAADKNYSAMAGLLSPHFQKIIISTPGHFKQSDPGQVYNSFKEIQKSTTLELEPANAYQKALEWAEPLIAQGQSVVVLVTGSFYMVAEIKKFLPGASGMQIHT